MNSIWEDISRILIKRRGIQRVLNHRFPNKVSRQKQKDLIIKDDDLAYWNSLLIKYGGMRDEELKASLAQVELEIEYELDRMFRFY